MFCQSISIYAFFLKKTCQTGYVITAKPITHTHTNTGLVSAYKATIDMVPG